MLQFYPVNCFLSILSLLLFVNIANAQLGVSAFSSGMHVPDWDHEVNENRTNFYFNGNYVALDYWFRLKDQRIEFHPEISYRSYKNYYEFRLYGFHLNTQVYPLSFFDDCDCPTFSKQEPILEKGLFVQLSPGYNLMKVTSFNALDPNVVVEDQSNFWDLGLGLGLDIGLSQLITVTPTARYRLGFGAEWERAPQLNPQNTVEAKPKWYEFGIRIGIRFDAADY